MCSHLSVQIPSPLAPSILFLQAQRGAKRSPEGGSVSSAWFSRSGAEGRHEPLSAAFSLSAAQGEPMIVCFSRPYQDCFASVKEIVKANCHTYFISFQLLGQITLQSSC